MICNTVMTYDLLDCLIATFPGVSITPRTHANHCVISAHCDVTNVPKKVDRRKTIMGKRSLCLIVLTLFFWVEEVQAGVSCFNMHFGVITITCSADYTMKRATSIDAIEKLFLVDGIKQEDVVKL